MSIFVPVFLSVRFFLLFERVIYRLFCFHHFTVHLIEWKCRLMCSKSFFFCTCGVILSSLCDNVLDYQLNETKSS